MLVELWALCPVETAEQLQNHNGSSPQQTDGDSETVEVSLGDTGASSSSLEAAAEHVGHAAAAALVQQNQCNEKETGQGQNTHDDVLDDRHKDLD